MCSLTMVNLSGAVISNKTKATKVHLFGIQDVLMCTGEVRLERMLDHTHSKQDICSGSCRVCVTSLQRYLYKT